MLNPFRVSLFLYFLPRVVASSNPGLGLANASGVYQPMAPAYLSKRGAARVQPAMDLQSSFVRFGKRECKRIKRRRLVLQLNRTWFDSRVVISIATAADLNDQCVEAIVSRGVYELTDLLWRCKRRAHDPERSHFLRCGRCASKRE